MKKFRVFKIQHFHRGFTLTEVLLAVMIVGLISVSLAALTRSGSREAGVGRSKIMLRNNLSQFMRTLRKDMTRASYIEEIAGPLDGTLGDPVALLKVAQNVDSSHTPIAALSKLGLTPNFVTYCFQVGSDADNIAPDDALRGGKIYRMEDSDDFPDCEDISDDDLLLTNVKYIPSSSSSVSYPVPLFSRNNFSRNTLNSLLTVKIITELNSTPIVNDVVEETFAMPMGY